MAKGAHDLTGQIVDRRYRVEYQLGRGGMGSVWSVQHIESLRHFALKTLESELSQGSEGRDRLLRETRAASLLRSPHVVEVVDSHMDYVHDDGEPLPYFVMERLDGFTLQNWIETRGPLDPGEVLWVMGQIGRALTLAHHQGIIHRDLKPSNIFLAVDAEGQLVSKLCDFGIAKLTSTAAAKLLTSEAKTTQAGSVLGTPLYLPPELLRGSGRATSATDQWALGLTVFSALTGSEYFGDSATGPELVLRIAQDPMPPPSTLDRRLPAGFDAWFLRSCARVPEERFEGVSQQVEALRLALGDPVPRAPVRAASRPPPLARSGGTLDPDADTVGSPRPSRRSRVMLAASALWAIAASILLLAWGPSKLAGVSSGPSSSAFSEGAIRSPKTPAHPPQVSEVEARPSVQSAVIAPEPVAKKAPLPRVSPDARHKAPADRARPPPVKASPIRAAIGGSLAAGAPCRRSAECASGLCVAEQCR
jgi:eukaryotic-like serine/threonine-protein kinase